MKRGSRERKWRKEVKTFTKMSVRLTSSKSKDTHLVSDLLSGSLIDSFIIVTLLIAWNLYVCVCFSVLCECMLIASC